MEPCMTRTHYKVSHNHYFSHKKCRQANFKLRSQSPAPAIKEFSIDELISIPKNDSHINLYKTKQSNYANFLSRQQILRSSKSKKHSYDTLKSVKRRRRSVWEQKRQFRYFPYISLYGVTVAVEYQANDTLKMTGCLTKNERW